VTIAKKKIVKNEFYLRGCIHYIQMNESRMETRIAYDNKQKKTTDANLRKKKTQTRVTANRRPQTRNKITTLSKIFLKCFIFFVPRGEIYT